MSDQVQQPVSQVADDEIDLRELFTALWQGKWLIIVTTFLFSVASMFYALSLPDIYKSEVTLAPVSEDSGLKIPGQLGGLAALAGVNLGGMGGGDKTGLALEILKSRDFIGRFIEQNDLYLPVMAAEGWSRSENKLLLNPKIYNEQTQQWVRKVKVPFQAKPSTLETVEEFKKLFSASQDKTSGMVKLSVSHYSPYLAKSWVEQLVNDINEELRNKDLSEAQAKIDYLSNNLKTTNIADLKVMLYALIEEQTKIMMLANTRSDYVFTVIDSALLPLKRHSPDRLVILITLTIIGFFSSCSFIVFRLFFNSRSA